MNLVLFSSVIGIIFFFYIIGSFVNISIKTNNIYTHYLINIGKSIYLSWIIVFILFLINLEINSSIFRYCVFLLFCIYILGYNKLLNSNKKINYFSYKYNIFIMITYIILFGLIFIFYIQKNYALIFVDWDALMSWNQWAVDLANNNWPSNGLKYPVLFPGLWSLIYRMQGNTEIWIFAKLSLYALYLILLFFLMSFEDYSSFNIFTLFFSIYNFLFLRNYELLSGMMDSVVCLFIYISGYYIILINNLKSKEYNHKFELYYLIAVIFGSLAPITKHIGFVALIIISYQLISDFYFKKINLNFFAIMLFILIFPFMLLTIMNGFEVNEKQVETIKYLYNFASYIALNENSLLHGVNVIYSELLRNGKLQGIFSILFFIIVILISSFNFLYCKKNLLGILFFIIAILNFIFYSFIASYDHRNSLTIFIFFALSASIIFLRSKNR